MSRKVNIWKEGYQIRDYYRAYGKQHGYNIGEKAFGDVLRSCFDQVIERLLRFENVDLPYRLGVCAIKDFKPCYQNVNGTTVKRGMIDWINTKKLWEEFPEKKLKVFVHQDLDRVYYFWHIYHLRGNRELRYYRLFPKKEFNKLLYHKFTLKENEAWQNNTLQ